MRLGSFQFTPQHILGVDIGTSLLKVVELSKWGERISLKNYGALRASSLYDRPFRTFEKNTLLLSQEDIARALRAILQEANIGTRRAVFSIPDFSSFFTNFTLPPMTKEEVPSAVEFEARKHIPVPLSEVTFDWQIIEGHIGRGQSVGVLLVAVPNEVIAQYREIARLAGLVLVAMEAEVFGFIRSCVGDERRPIVMVDIGAQSTTINAVAKKMLRMSHSVDVAGNSFTERISQSLSLDRPEAERAKHTQGMNIAAGDRPLLSPLVDIIIGEIQKFISNFRQVERQEAAKVIIGGGTAALPGLQEYIASQISLEVATSDPFRSVYAPAMLESVVREMGPSYAVAVGIAMREFF
ncbi:MAG: type IV pilus assembly protein PilM [Candidatus Wildermuthbacteria bacterium]|nr:type IV pilus assembly protein PilM [Candidatus Wildermuthbacteria bacterium]